MRGLMIAAVLLFLGGMAWLLVSNQDPPPAQRPTETRTEPPEPGPSAGMSTPVRRRYDASIAEPPVIEAPPSHQEAPPSHIEVRPEHIVVEVRDQTTGRPLPGFRYVLERASGHEAAIVEGHELAVALTAGEAVVLTIEAEGYEPSAPQRLQGGTGAQREQVLLAPALQFTGVELHVQTPRGTPMTHLEVEAIALDPSQPDAPGHSLWRRQAAAPDGVYPLPDLKPGSYRLRLRSHTAAGKPTTDQLHDEAVEFTGTERIVRNIRLRPGAQITIEARDADGRTLGTEVVLRLIHPDASTPSTRWVATGEDALLVRDDGLPAATTCRLDRPVAPGRYRLELRLGTGPVTALDLDLGAGETRALFPVLR